MDYFSFGHKGSPDAVWALGVMDLDAPSRQELLNGCQKAANDGTSANLQTFFAAYIAYRWQKTPGFDYYFLDNDYRRFFTQPAMDYIERGVTPGDKALEMTAAITPALQRRHALYLLLEHAIADEMNFQAEGIVRAGADVNMCLSRAVLIAFDRKDMKMLRILHAGGANFFAAANQLNDPEAKKEFELLHYKFQHDEDRAEIKKLRRDFDDVSARLEQSEKEKAAQIKNNDAAPKPPAP
jgi:hypothetical protein